MSQPAAYFQYPSAPAPTPAPTATTPTPAPAPAPATGKFDLSNREYVTKDTYCLYTAQGQIVCNKRKETLPVAPWGNEK